MMRSVFEGGVWPIVYGPAERVQRDCYQNIKVTTHTVNQKSTLICVEHMRVSLRHIHMLALKHRAIDASMRVEFRTGSIVAIGRTKYRDVEGLGWYTHEHIISLYL